MTSGCAVRALSISGALCAPVAGPSLNASAQGNAGAIIRTSAQKTVTRRIGGPEKNIFTPAPSRSGKMPSFRMPDASTQRNIRALRHNHVETPAPGG